MKNGDVAVDCRVKLLLSLLCMMAILAVSDFVRAADPTPSEKAITEAIKLLEAKRDTIDDAIEQAKVDKAIRELEALIEDPDNPKPEAMPAPIDFDVTPAMLKKKFAGKAIFNPKTHELTLTYDFAGKAQLSDFEVNDTKAVVSKKFLGIDAGDKLKHVARFKTFTASAVMSFKGMRGVGIESTNGSQLSTGGRAFDTVILRVADSQGASKIVPANVRSGTVPISLSITTGKTSIQFAAEKLSQPTARKGDIHQVVLVGGVEGCGFGNLTIVGVPDTAWLKDFLAAE